MTNPYRARLLASTLFAGAALFAHPALAQQADPVTPGGGAITAEAAPAAAEDTGGDIVVTGTLIRNPNLVSSSPVAIIGQDEIQLRQNYNAEQLLRGIPGVAADIGTSVNNGNGGASFVNLRGLGSQRNIVLLDGTRITPANLDGAVDLNNIPVALIERTDVLTGGASTTYGADAVSGVVNFVTKRDFAGVDLNLGEQISDRGDGNQFRVDLTVGGNFADDRGNAVFSIGYQESDPVFQAGDRVGSRATVDSFNGTAAGGSATAVPARFNLPGLGNGNINPTTGLIDFPNTATFNFNPFNLFQTPFKRFNMYGAAHYEISDAIEVYNQGLFSKNTVKTIVAPSGAFAQPLFLPLNNPFLPAGARAQFCANSDSNPLVTGVQTLTAAQCAAAGAATSPSDPNYREVSTTVSRRLVEAGGRTSTYETQLFNYRMGARGAISDSLSYDIYGAYGESENTQTQSGYALTSRFQQGLRALNSTTCVDSSTACSPINLFGAAGSISPAAASFLQADATSANKTTLAQVHGLVNGDLFKIGSASEAVSFAVGGEYRRYTARITADILAQDPSELGGAGGAVTPVSGGYDVYEAFGELIVPVISDQPFFKSLTFETGVRYSKYSVDAAGSPSFNATTYKGGGTWEPVDGLKIRGNYQRAVRAPNIGELFQPQRVNLNNLKTDPCQGSAPLSNALLAAVCRAQIPGNDPNRTLGAIAAPSAGQVNVTLSGNPNAKPEKSDSYSGGVVFLPSFVPGFSISVDYYNIKVKNAITAPATGDVIAACFGNLSAASINDPRCITQIVRSVDTGGLDGDPGSTPGLFSPTTNSGRLATDGIDVTANYRTSLTDQLKMALSFQGNYTFNSKFQSTPGGLNRQCVGYYSVNCGYQGSILPEFSFNQRTTLSYGAVDVSLLWRHISSVKQEPRDALAFSSALQNFDSNGPAFAAFRKIKAYDWFDLSGRFGVTENFDLTITAINLFDKKPPLVGNNIGNTSFNSGNTYPSTYDAVGRRFAAGARLKF